MPDDWTEMVWGEIATLEYGRALRTHQDTAGSVRVYGTNGPIGWHTEAQSEGPGVIIGRKGAYRGIHYSPGPFFVIDTAFYLKPKRDVNLRWAYYNLLLSDINSMDSGSAIPSTSRDEFYQIPVLVPPKRSQDAIASILGALDDKVELNRRMNETLEALARAIFKSWFVDFDPVRAKAEGRKPLAMDDATAALFPDRFGPDGLPEGWRNDRLESVVMVNPSERLQTLEEAPYIDMASLPARSSTVTGWRWRPFSSGSKFRNGDTLLARITPCLENGKTAFVDCLPNDALIGWGSTEFIVLRPRAPFPAAYAYLLARTSEFRSHAIQSMTGTSGRQRVQPQAVAGYPVAVPDDGRIPRAFGQLVAPWFAMIRSNAEQTGTLAALRDLLLPKLMSGEIPIRDAEASVEDAV